MNARKFTFVVFVLIVMMFIACSQTEQKDDLDVIASFMIGSFDSKEQSLADTNFFNIHLEMVRIWENRDDAIWLYVEQAASRALEKPYRQRVYKLTKGEEGKLISEVFTFNNPLRFAGAYKEKAPLNVLTPDSLSVREGCAIILEKNGEIFEGSTVGKDCGSNLRGASYATSKVKIEKDVLTSWDQGFDAEDNQVWGAVTGPYIFKKRINVKNN